MRKLFFYTVDEHYFPIPLNHDAAQTAETDQHSRWRSLTDKIATLSRDSGFEPVYQPQLADEIFSPAVIVLFLPTEALGKSAFFDHLPGSCIRPIRSLEDREQEMDMRYQPIVTVAMPDIMDFHSETQHREQSDEEGKKYFFDLNPDARFKFLDSSIWHRYVPLSPRDRKHTFEQMLQEIMSEISRHWNDGLYRTNAAIATLEFQLRMLQHSYIAKTGVGGHAVAVKPFKFHSETWMKRKAAEEIEFFTGPVWEGDDLIGQLSWRALIVDDYAEKNISCTEGSICELNKTQLILRPVQRLYEEKLKKEKGKVSPRAVAAMRREKFAIDSAIVNTNKKQHGMLFNAQGKLRAVAYDIIFLDYLLDHQHDGQREYGHDLVLELLRNDREINTNKPDKPFRRDFMGRYWVFPISSFPFAFPDKLNQLGVSHLHEIWHLSSGGDPIAAPHLFAYYLYRFMKQKVAKYFLYPEALRRFLNEAPVNTEGERNRKFWAEFLQTAVAIRRRQDALLEQTFDSTTSPFIKSMRDFLKGQEKLEGLLDSIEEILGFFLDDFPLPLSIFEEKCKALLSQSIDSNYEPVLRHFTGKAIRLARKEYKIALGEIKRHKRKKASSLDLSGKNLTEIPPEISELRELEKLNLSGNRLTDFPPSLFKLPKLEVVDLADNKIQGLPSAGFEIMNRLKKLDLTGNPFLGKSIEAGKGKTFAEAMKEALPVAVPGNALRQRIFISYAHADRSSKNRLLEKLKTFEISCDFIVWEDGQVRPGELWDEKIKENLMAARIIIFLASDAMINSVYIKTVELKTALDRQAEPENTRPHIVPIILKKCEWQSTDLCRFQAATFEGRTIDSYKPQNNGWHEAVASVVKKLLQ